MKSLIIFLLPLTVSGFCCGWLGQITEQTSQVSQVAEAAVAVASGDEEQSGQEVAEAILSASGVEAEFGSEIDFAKHLGFELPLPEGATPLFSMAVDGGVMAQYQTGLTQAEVTEFFQTEMTALGFTQSGQFQMNDGTTQMENYVFDRDGQTLNISIYTTAEGTAFQIISGQETGGQ
ncbi:MAG TPA: hypothetical protein PKD98_01570 [Anaerolineae bacterium]|nr:hypothetical protein [Anaerolineae bacterium]